VRQAARLKDQAFLLRPENDILKNENRFEEEIRHAEQILQKASL
jgi:hypothetical protein